MFRKRVEAIRGLRRPRLALSVGAVLAVVAPVSAHAATLRELTYLQVVSNVAFNQQINAAQKLGVGGVRLSIRWADIEKARGRFNWLATDGRIAAIERRGLVPLIVVFGGNANYPLAERLAGSTPSTEEGVLGFARFAGEAAKRYGAGTPERPIVYELWNEPNTRTFWGRAPEPGRYADIAQRACEAIRQASPTAKVLALAMEGTPVKPRYFVKAYGLDIYQEWARRAATPGLMACADGFSMHPYLNPPEQHHAFEPALQAFVAAHWRKASPPMIAHTEWGYHTDPSKGRTPERQAAFDLRALLIGAGSKRITNLYQSVDTGKDPARPVDTYGFVTYFGEIKPNGAALKRLLDAIGDYEIDGLEASAANPRIFRFKASHDGAPAEVVWTPDGSSSLEILAGGAAVDLVSGTARPVEKGRITVDGTPVLITWGP